MVSELGDPGRPPIEVLAEPQRGAGPATTSRSTTFAAVLAATRRRPDPTAAPTEETDMSETSQQQVDLVVRTIAQTALDNEKYFGDLDAVVGDGDFGYSLARGFEKVLEGWDDLDRTDLGTFLKKVGMIDHLPDRRHLRPDLGHRVPAGRDDRRRDGRRSTGEQVVAMLRAAIEGIKARGQSDVGRQDPARRAGPDDRRLEEELAAGADAGAALAAAAATAREAAEATSEHDRQARPGVLHGRAQQRLGRRRRHGRRRASSSRSARHGLADDKEEPP